MCWQVYMDVCMCVCVFVSMFTHMWRSEDNLGCHSSGTIYFFIWNYNCIIFRFLYPPFNPSHPRVSLFAFIFMTFFFFIVVLFPPKYVNATCSFLTYYLCASHPRTDCLVLVSQLVGLFPEAIISPAHGIPQLPIVLYQGLKYCELSLFHVSVSPGITTV